MRLRGYRIGGVYTYGSPAIGNSEAVRFVDDRVLVLRYFHPSDPVPRVPLAAFGYSRAVSEIDVTTFRRVGDLRLAGSFSLPTGFYFSAHSIDGPSGPV